MALVNFLLLLMVAVIFLWHRQAMRSARKDLQDELEGLTRSVELLVQAYERKRWETVGRFTKSTETTDVPLHGRFTVNEFDTEITLSYKSLNREFADRRPAKSCLKDYSDYHKDRDVLWTSPSIDLLPTAP